MAKFEISLTTDYVPNWDAWAGIREVLQNAQDQAELDETCPMKVAYSSTNKRLTITSENVVLDRSVLLLGETSKRGTDSRGKFGEGLDLALLALVRKGFQIRIENGYESWIPDIEYSETWGRNVLVVKTNRFKRPKSHFKFEITGLSVDNWELVQKRVLFLKGAIKPDERVMTVDKQKILLDRPGDVFVRGLWVGNFKDLVAGYDLYDVELDRDRRIIEGWRLKSELGQLWSQAVADEALRKHAQERVEKMLTDGATDVEGLQDVLGYNYNPDVPATKAALVKGFEEKYGPKAVPVDSTSEAQEVEASGLKPVPVSTSWKRTLQKATGKDTTQRVREAVQDVQRTFTPTELTDLGLEGRWQILNWIHEKVGGTCPLSIVEFGGAGQLGKYKREASGETVIYIALSVLHAHKPGEALVTLAHELGHHLHLDHGKAHEHITEVIMADIINLASEDWFHWGDRMAEG